MGWKDLPYWLRGGLISITIYWIIFLILFYFYSTSSDIGIAVLMLIFLVPYVFITLGPLESTLEYANIPEVYLWVLAVIVQTTTYFLIGAFIAKLKSKNNHK